MSSRCKYFENNRFPGTVYRLFDGMCIRYDEAHEYDRTGAQRVVSVFIVLAVLQIASRPVYTL